MGVVSVRILRGSEQASAEGPCRDRREASVRQGDNEVQWKRGVMTIKEAEEEATTGGSGMSGGQANVVMSERDK